MATDPTTIDADPEAARRANLPRESGVKSVGQLCYLVGFFSVLGTIEFALFAVGVLATPPELKAHAGPELVRLAYWVLALGFLLNALGQAVLGYGLIHLHDWARWTVVALTAISLASHAGLSLVACAAYPIPGLISLVVGAAVHGLILYPLVEPGSGVVFSDAYKEVIRRTPGIRSRMHWLLKLLIGLILAGVVGLVAYLAAIYFRIID